MATRSKGDGSIYQTAEGRWRGSIETGWTRDGRQRRYASGKTRAEVARKLARIKTEVEAGMVGQDPTTGEWLEHWYSDICPSRGLKPSTLYGYRSYLDTWLIPQLGRRKLRTLTPEHVRRLHGEMRDAGKSAATIRQAHAILSRALKVAEREGIVRRNVAALVDVPSPGDVHHGELTTEQAKRVLRAAQTPRELARLTCALVLGLRQGEALGLRWSAVDLDAGTIEVSAALTVRRGARKAVEGAGPTLTTPKSLASRRLIPLPQPVVDVLKAWRDMADDPDWVFPSLATGRGPERVPRDDWQAWRDALARAGVPAVPLHGARATAASLLMEMGVPDRTAADILGHAQVATTRRHYQRSSDAGRKAALDGAAAQLLAT